MRHIVILILSLFVSVHLVAETVLVKDIELLDGEQFTQLRFVTNQATPPIPDVTELTSNRLALSKTDWTYQLPHPSLKFNSNIIKSIEIGENQLEIELYTKTQYRLFSNENGLFIEFPKAQGKTSAASIANPAIEKPTQASPLVSIQNTGDNSLTFLINVPPKTPYKVIPIEEAPFRLALDLQGVSAQALKEDIDRLNVKKIRGGYNAPGTYRLVFDLDYMVPYTVSAQEGGITVDFFTSEKATTLAKETAQPKPQPTVIEESVEKATTVASEPETPKNTPFFKEETAPAGSTMAQTEESPVASSPAPPIGSKTVIQEGAQSYTGALGDFVFKNADLINVLKMISKIAELNLVVDPGVTGRVTSELVQVPWDQALDIFLKINKLDKVIEGNILRIGKVDELADEAKKRREMQEAREVDVKLEVIIRPLSYAKATSVASILDTQLSKRGKIQIDARSNSLVITEVPDRVKTIDRLIASLDVANQQVSIEARIIETNHTDAKAFGILWGVDGAMSPRYGNQTTMKFPNSIELTPGLTNNYAINLPIGGKTAPNTAVGLSFGNVVGSFNLDVMLQSMEMKGRVRILSAPRTTTQNNMEAEILNGKRIPVQTIQPNGTYSMQYINAALELKVKPQITAEGTIITDVDIKNDQPDFSFTINQNPLITTQSAKNSIMVKDGGTIVIGGLYRVEANEKTEAVPGLSKIPLLGNLFKNKAKYSEKREMLIFITPRIVK